MPAADFLTAELSKASGIVLLERAQVQKILQEQGLAAGASDPLKLGQVLGADGLLVLMLAKETEPPKLDVRLIAVRAGAALQQREYPWPLQDTTQWIQTVARQFEPLLPKLAVPAKDAVPLSILNIRSAVASSDADLLERQLSLLLYNRLMRERDVFVLERRKLELLEEEKWLAGVAESPFWRGAYLIEGLVDKAGVKKDTLTISGRLIPPDKKDIITLEISGARANLPAVINELALRILASLKKSGPAAEWQPLAEASRYLDEAKWMFRWGQFEEAKAASEAAWALGAQTREATELRIRAFYESAGDPGSCAIDNVRKLVAFGRPRNPQARDPSDLIAYSVRSEAERFADIVRAVELFSDALGASATQEPGLDPARLELGARLLERASAWLRYYYFNPEARTGHEDGVVEARRLARQLAESLESQPAYAKVDTNLTLLLVKAKHAAFWADTPEQCLQFYQAILQAGHWPRVRSRFIDPGYGQISPDRVREGRVSQDISSAGVQADLANPCVAGWKWADRQRAPSVWSQFIDQTCASTNVLIGFEGRFLRCADSWASADFERNLSQALDFVRLNRQTITTAGLEQGILNDLRGLVQRRADSLLATDRQRVKEQLWGAFEKEFSPHPLEQKPGPVTAAISTKPAPPPSLPQPRSAIPLSLTPGTAMALTIPPTNTTSLATVYTPLTSPPSNLLEVTRFWRMPEVARSSQAPIGSDIHLATCCYRDGRLWVEVRQWDRVDFIGVNLETFTSDTVSLESQNGSPLLIQPSGEAPDRFFEVYGGYIYLSIYDSILRCATNGTKWESYQVPAAGRARPVRLGNRLFLTSDHSILECAPDATFRLLASNRRQPAETALDNVQSYGLPQLFLTPDGILHACINKVVYCFEATTNDWRRVGTLPGLAAVPWSPCYAFDGGILVADCPPDRANELWGVGGGFGQPERLFSEPPPRRLPYFQHPSFPGRTNPVTTKARWPLPPGASVASLTPCMQDQYFWFLQGTLDLTLEAGQNLRFKEVNHQHAALLRLSVGEQELVTIPLRFHYDNTCFCAGAAKSMRMFQKPEIAFCWTPNGLVISRRLVSGFWFIPKADLDRSILASAVTHLRSKEKGEAIQRSESDDSKPDRQAPTPSVKPSVSPGV